MAKKDINEKLLQALGEAAEELQFISEMQGDTEIDHYRADISLSEFLAELPKRCMMTKSPLPLLV